ncbi:uncharacterized protein BDR25DRAFT_352700 [Lindgomyces ingoldianus]|uniref:Uncharacterized protein n=1 Tax=Lindgomyces ingoldianus TaxID=673940 RepID=A0ACB6R1R7_9PLEO|nr:uncharacterized protein BDR25DRAFT_352700 [Lindgomyces ingoldianus]KAF2473269.1 hypothetical protein BDR25DRAFT_352700 [Lindgomyces ingoldianus]
MLTLLPAIAFPTSPLPSSNCSPPTSMPCPYLVSLTSRNTASGLDSSVSCHRKTSSSVIW